MDDRISFGCGCDGRSGRKRVETDVRMCEWETWIEGHPGTAFGMDYNAVQHRQQASAGKIRWRARRYKVMKKPEQ